jgi:hypothetical protein
MSEAMDASTQAESAHTTSMPESAEVRARVADLRTRFTIAATPTTPATAVIGAASAMRFEQLEDGHARAVVPPEAKRAVLRSASVALPMTAREGVRLEDDTTHVAITFALEDAADVPLTVADGIARYAGAWHGADVVHRVHAEGTEDFVVLEEKPSREELRYVVDVSRAEGLRLVSNVLEIVDRDGAPRLRVRSPFVVDASGTRTDASIAVEGCDYDTNPAAPWGRPVTRPGAINCIVRIAWDSVAYPAVVDPSWVATGSMNSARSDYAGALIAGGNVLIAGGANGSTYWSTAELFDGTSTTFATTGSMSAPRTSIRATGTLLLSGNVLLTGGNNASGSYLSTAELYNPTTGAFSLTGPMKTPRSGHTATRISGGKVLVVGGLTTGGAATSTAELYDGTTAFTSVGNLTYPRNGHATTLMNNGKVLVTGGYGGASTNASTAEIFDNTTSTFALTGSMATCRFSHGAVLLPNGKVLVAGGYNGCGFNSAIPAAELFDGVSSFTATGDMTTARQWIQIVPLSTGRALVAGGYGGSWLSSAEIFDGTSTFHATASMTTPRAAIPTIVLSSGRVLMAGGINNNVDQSSAEILALASNGAACTIADDCLSGMCNQNCCSASCTATCFACASGSGACVPVVNADDPPTCTGANTCDATGACKLKSGQLCPGGATTCASGICDESCCSTACGGACQTCNGTGACVAVKYADDPDTCTGANTCDFSGACKLKAGQACPGGPITCATAICDENCCSAACNGACQTCTSTGDCGVVTSADDPDTCTGANTCDSTGVCKLKAGQSCTSGGQCASTFCNESCCSAACTGTCKTCSPSGGCVTVANADDPNTCTGANTCNGAGACLLKVGQPCTTASQCASNSCVNGYCCNGACNTSCVVCAQSLGATANGQCTTAPVGYTGSPACATGYACDGTDTTCITPCTQDADCANGYFCNASGQCVTQHAQGQACSLASDCKQSGACRECSTGNCVDGVCCDTACNTICNTCLASLKQSGADGTCGPVAYEQPPPAREGTCPTSPPCGADGKCSGAGTCNIYTPPNTSCAASTCAGTVVVASTCNGSGSCQPAPTSTNCSPFNCVNGSCTLTCAVDTDCAPDAYCNGTTCAKKQTNGAVCTKASTCASGNCVDGYCCNGACAGECEACDASGAQGTCVPVSGQPHGARPACAASGNACVTAVCDGVTTATCNGASNAANGTSCGVNVCVATTIDTQQCMGGVCTPVATPTNCDPFTCTNQATGATCTTSCAQDADCAGDGWCSGNVCISKQANGAVCTRPGACSSGNCVDGYCCNTSCSEECQACDAVGLQGTCAPVIGQPHGSRPLCPSGANACASPSCDGMTTASCAGMANRPNGYSCGASTCNGTIATGQICDGNGACVNNTTGANCDPFQCVNGSCTIRCSVDSDCATDAYCNNGTCAGKLTNGAVCTKATACQSELCVDNYCCVSACTGECEACDAAGAEGTCVAITGKPHSARAPCPTGSTCGTPACDGSTRTSCAGESFAMAGTACGAATCNGTKLVSEACDGSGNCVGGAATTTDCAPFQCASGACTTSCAQDADCAAGAYCKGGSCVAQNTDAHACTANDQCASQFCVDGYCCDSPCTGQCEACDIAGAEGTCAPITDAPHGTRSACPSGDADVCSAAKCDGKDRTECAGFVGPSMSCRAASCMNGVQTLAAGCDGMGHCPAAETKSCDPYACDPSSNACFQTCTKDSDCATGNPCSNGKCVSGATCDGAHTIKNPDGTQTDCAPYNCQGSTCRMTCASVNDCASPNVCDTTNHCVAPAPSSSSGSSGGCAASNGQHDDPWALLLGSLGSALLLARRRRDSRIQRR